MKKLAYLLTLTLALAVSPAVYAQAKKKAPETKPAAEAPAAEPKPAAKPAAKPAETKPAKPLPFNTVADEIDAPAKAIWHTNEDGKKVKNVVTDKTEIKQGEAAAKFEDIKVGDTVAGLRIKKDAEGTEYDIVKITKFGPKPAKAAPEKKGEKKAEEPKKAAK